MAAEDVTGKGGAANNGRVQFGGTFRARGAHAAQKSISKEK